MYSSTTDFIRCKYCILLFCLAAFLQVKGETAASNRQAQSTAIIQSFQSSHNFKVDTGGGILPLHNFTLSVVLKENIVFIKWLAENEMNTEKFVIQRSSDGNIFKNLGELPPSGPINILTEYNSSDDITGISSGVAYYRIKAEDNRGNFAYSNVVPVRLFQSGGFSFWPNPFSTSLSLSFNANLSTSIKVEMYDNSGRQVIQQQFSINRGMNQLSITGAASLPQGLYHVRIIDLLTQEVSFSKMTK